MINDVIDFFGVALVALFSYKLGYLCGSEWVKETLNKNGVDLSCCGWNTPFYKQKRCI